MAATKVRTLGKNRFEIINGIECDARYVFSQFFQQTVSTLTQIAANGGGTITLLNASSPATYKIISSSSNDDGDPAGTGVRTVRIWSYDTSDVLQYEDATLNGTTGVSLTETNVSTFIYMQALTTGALTVAAGNIRVTNEAGDVFYLAIDSGTTSGFLKEIPFRGGWSGIMDTCAAAVIATTATDNFAVALYEREYQGSMLHAVAYAAPMSPGAITAGTQSACLKKTMRDGKAYTLYGLKNTSDQTVSGLIKIGFVKGLDEP
jgi:hypothetical protein